MLPGQRGASSTQRGVDSGGGQRQPGPSDEEVKEVKKTLNSWKESDFPKLAHTISCSKPAVFEEWILRFERSAAASHSLSWTAFNLAKAEAERAYREYLNTTSARQVSIGPNSYLRSDHAVFLQIDLKLQCFISASMPQQIARLCLIEKAGSAGDRIFLFRRIARRQKGSRDRVQTSYLAYSGIC